MMGMYKRLMVRFVLVGVYPVCFECITMKITGKVISTRDLCRGINLRKHIQSINL